MIFAEEKATVSHILGDFVFLETQNNPSCVSCSSKAGCGQVASIFTFKPKNKLKVNNTLKLKEGDEVIVAMPTGTLLKATVLMYLLPLILLFLFSLIAKLALGESASIVGGVLGLLVGLVFVNRYSQQTRVSQEFQPKLLRKVINVNLV